MKPPDLESATREAHSFLVRLGFQEPPIDIDYILKEVKLVQQPLPEFDRTLLKAEQAKVFDQVHGVLNIPEKTIFISPGVQSNRRTFLLLHEVGHDSIEWHREMLYLDRDYELGQAVRDEMEMQANAFAAELLFLGKHFDEYSRGLEFGAASIFHLAEVYGASIESTVHHYIKRSLEQCICFVLESNGSVWGSTLIPKYFLKPTQRGGWWNFDYEIGVPLEPNDPLVTAWTTIDLRPPNTHIRTHEDSSGLYFTEVFEAGPRVYVICSFKPMPQRGF